MYLNHLFESLKPLTKQPRKYYPKRCTVDTYKAFQYFNDDMVVPAEYTGKLTHYYLDDAMEGTITDYRGKTVYYRSESGIYLEKTPYNLSLQNEYLQYLKQVQGVLI